MVADDRDPAPLDPTDDDLSETFSRSDDVAARLKKKNEERRKRRSKVRTKFVLESLREEMIELQEENERLRGIIQSRIPQPEAEKILAAFERPPVPQEIMAPAPEENTEMDSLSRLTKQLDIHEEESEE